jgi:hypothetical protein
MPLVKTGVFRDWIELIRSLGAALLEVYRAELADLKGDVRDASIHLVWALGLLLGAGVIAFWAVATLVFFVIEMLALWLPLWGAVGVVLLLLVGTVLTLLALGLRRLKRWENPAETVRRRLTDHRSWLEGEFLGEEGPEEPAETGAGGSEDVEGELKDDNEDEEEEP